MATDGLVDLHLHLLPGIDDGAREPEQAVEMAQGLAAAGFARVVCTPHIDDTRHLYGHERISELADALRGDLAAAGVALEVDFGAEYAYGARFHDDLVGRRLITLAGSRYVLLELPDQALPARMAQTLFKVGAAGYYPVLAHPERCQAFHNDADRLEAIASGRALVQVSFRSLAGKFGRAVKKTAWALLHEGIADLVATDCHRPKELGGVVRPVLAELRKRLGGEQLDALMVHTPTRMLSER